MKIQYHVKRKASFKENVVHILPQMFDNMMSYKETVANHPRMNNVLHRMRITGKPMRYIMEIMEPYSGKEFSQCLHEIKNLLELMGDIHDCDVFITELREYLFEVREYNRLKIERNSKLNASSITKLISDLKSERNKHYESLCEFFNKLEKENFKDKLNRSLIAEKTNEINYFNSKKEFVKDMDL